MARTATTTVSFSLSSSDLTSSALNISASQQLKKAGSRLGLSQTTGLAIKTTSSASAAVITADPLFRGDGATADKANKVYLRNLSTIDSEYFTVYIDQEEMGRLYAGDFAFFPWKAASGTKIDARYDQSTTKLNQNGAKSNNDSTRKMETTRHCPHNRHCHPQRALPLIRPRSQAPFPQELHKSSHQITGIRPVPFLDFVE